LKDKEVVDTLTPEDDEKATKEKVHEIWAKHMHDFVPADLMNFIVE